MSIQMTFLENQNICTWLTCMVGFRLKLINAKNIECYAVRYLENNPAYTNPYIAELAIGPKNGKADYLIEIEIDHLLSKIVARLGYSLSEGSLEYEKRKLRYLLLNELAQAKEHNENIEEKIYSLYQTFNYPEDMSEFVQCSCCSAWYNDEFRERFLAFLTQEKNILFL
ncbi:DUF2247 family protein [Candidatus Dependentiae bacterium]|nr:DUF2247 family protein [Candidatus Dependentiae bacterium]